MADWVFISDSIKLHDGFMESMKSVLYAADRHAVVFGQVIEDKESMIKTALEFFPDYTLTTHVNLDCIMIKKSIIDLFGEPDVSGDNTQKALTEYCDKLNSYGFPAAVAHRALYSHKDKSLQTNDTSDANSPFVQFLTLLDDGYYHKKRILFECFNMPCTHNGTTETMLNTFKAFNRLYGDKYDIFFYTKREAAEYHGLAGQFDNILYPETICGTFHLGFSPVQMMWYEPQLLLNKHCLKIVVQVLDSIISRCREYTVSDAKSNTEMGARISDGITFISNYSKNDFCACYASDGLDIDGKKNKVIYVAKGDTEPIKDDYELPFKDYFLVVGNSLKHKAITETVEVVADMQYNFIVVGAKEDGYCHGNIYGYEGGQLDEDLVNYLYAHCRAVIFPSLYEGFGLPTVMGLKNGKRVILCDNSLNREMQEHFSEFREHFIFFNKFEQIADILDTTDFTLGVKPVAYDDSWDRVATQLEAFFVEILSDKVDADKLRERWRICNHIEALLEDPLQTIDDLCVHNNLQHEHMVMLDRQKNEAERQANEAYFALNSMLAQFGDYKLSSMMRFAVKENIKHRHPKLADKLKG